MSLNTHSAKAGLAAAIEALTQAGLARSLDLTRQAIHKWEVVPLKRVLEVEAATGVSRHVLRPDVFGAPIAKRRKVS